jgi:phosphoribosylformimino-5-aminoimidazole carboxamide ribotide isomerase
VIAVPAIDLRDGACVQLVGGSYEAERVRIADPVEVASRWWRAGFTELHVVDLDAATGRGGNQERVESILESWQGGIQVGGGMGDGDRIAAAIRRGADRVVVGTRAVEDPEWLEVTARAWPGRVVVAADVRGADREVVIRGWDRGSGRKLADVIARVADLPLAGLLITAVDLEGRLEGPDLPLTREAASQSRHPIQASGGIRSVDDLRALADAGAERAVIGMALYTGILDPEAAAREFGR